MPTSSRRHVSTSRTCGSSCETTSQNGIAIGDDFRAAIMPVRYAPREGVEAFAWEGRCSLTRQAQKADVVVIAHQASGGVGMSTTTPRPSPLARVGDYIEVGRGHHSVRLTRKRIVVLLNRAIVLGEVEVGTFRLDEVRPARCQGVRGRGDGMRRHDHRGLRPEPDRAPQHRDAEDRVHRGRAYAPWRATVRYSDSFAPGGEIRGPVRKKDKPSASPGDRALAIRTAPEWLKAVVDARRPEWARR